MNRNRLAITITQHRKWLEYNTLVDGSYHSAFSLDVMPFRGVRADFSGETLEGLSLPETDLSGAIMDKANMRSTNLSKCRMITASLVDTDLAGANLALVQANEADLSGADLSDSNLQWANLQFAKMEGVKLGGAKICYAIGDGMYIKNLHPTTPDGWWLTYTATHMSIGCNHHSLEDWEVMSDDQIRQMSPGALKLWKINKQPIFDAIKAFPAREYR